MTRTRRHRTVPVAMTDDWTIECACRAAWRAERVTRIGDWPVARLRDASRRINAASPAIPAATLDRATLTAVEIHFADAPALFRIPDFLPGADMVLTRAGYAAPGTPTQTLARVPPPAHADGAILTPTPTDAWLAARARLTRLIEARHVDHAAAIARLTARAVPVAFAAIHYAGAIAALACAAHIGDTIVIEAVASDPAHRRRGSARRCVAALLGWGAGRGAASAALQVAVDNAAARALYRGMGFAPRYGYHYRRRGG